MLLNIFERKMDIALVLSHRLVKAVNHRSFLDGLSYFQLGILRSVYQIIDIWPTEELPVPFSWWGSHTNDGEVGSEPLAWVSGQWSIIVTAFKDGTKTSV